jgi:hypothetical protein
MERFLARLERRFGAVAIPRLAIVIAVTSALVFALGMMRPGFLSQLVLVPQLVKAGQLWRLVTWVFVPPGGDLLWTAIGLLFYANIGTTLEQAWGSFKLNVYYLLGVVGTIVASFVTGEPMASVYLHTTVFFAFATLFPDVEFLLFFVVPVRAKWSALIAAAFLGWAALQGGWSTRIAIAIAIGNYLLFFAGHLLGVARGVAVVERQRARRSELYEERAARPKRACKICGLTDDDEGADLRVCTCQEVCGGKATVYCLKHARSHNQPT